MSRKQNLNLKPPYTSDQNREEASKNGKKGGIASGEARRRKKTMTQLINQYLNFKVKDPKQKKQLKDAGFDEEEFDNKTMLMMSIVKHATRGNVKFADLAVKLSKDDELIELEKKRIKNEIKESNLRIERQKLENERLKNSVNEKNDCEDWSPMYKLITGQDYNPEVNPNAEDEDIDIDQELEDDEEESSVVVTNE